METIQTPSTVTTISSSSRGIFGSKIPASAAFIIAILLFLLPFAEIKCGNETVANQTGVGFVMGWEWKAHGLFDQKDLKKGSSGKDSLGNSQVISIAVLVLAILGLLLLLATSNGGVAGVLGLLSACGLIYFMIDLKNAFNADVKKDAVDQATQAGSETGLGQITNAFNDVKPNLGFTPVFWIILLLLLAAAFFSWRRGKMKMGSV